MTDLLNYSQRLEDAGLRIVRGVIEEVERNGLPGDHHFYLTFDTDHEGVELADRLRTSYPGEMTVVLQHQYEDLETDDQGFAVTLSFSSVPYRLRVPWAALRRFVDPAANFGLEFHGAAKQRTDTQELGPRPIAEPTPVETSRDKGSRSGSTASGPHRLPADSSSPATAGGAAGSASETDAAEVPETSERSQPAERTESPKEDSGEQVVRLDDFRKK